MRSCIAATSTITYVLGSWVLAPDQDGIDAEDTVSALQGVHFGN